MNCLEKLMVDLGLETEDDLLSWKDQNPRDPIAMQLEEFFQVVEEGDQNES